MTRSWYDVWYEPSPHETVAFLTEDRMAQIGGATPETIYNDLDLRYFIIQGCRILAGWCRVNCIMPGSPVNVRGKTGWVFKHESDALLFKLTWGG